MRWLVSLSMVSALLVPGSACAQTDFSATTLGVGQAVRVTDPTGVSVQGVITGLTASTLRIGGHVFEPVPGLKVERLGDPLWDGAALGFGVGALLGASVDRTGCYSGKGPGCIVKPGLVFGGIATLIDRALVRRRTVFLGRAPGSGAFRIRTSGRALIISLTF